MRSILAAALALEPLSLSGPQSPAKVFREGDEVVLSDGPYRRTPGIFRRLRNDVAWADITERNGQTRSHPIAWLALAPSKTAGVPSDPPVGPELK